MEKILSFITKKEVLGTAITILAAYIIYRIAKSVVDKLLSRSKSEFQKKRQKTVTELLKKILRLILACIALIIILDLFGVNVSSLVASLGIASAVGALALQDTLKDAIGGAAIILDNYFVVGDYVRYGDFLGTVIEFGIRATKIMNFDGEVLIVANRKIDEIINLSQKTASALIVAPTAYEEDTKKVDKILSEITEEVKTWETVNKTKTEYLGLIEMKDSCINYGIRIYCSPGHIWEYKRAVLRLIKERYDKNNIKIPYNQIEVHNEK